MATFTPIKNTNTNIINGKIYRVTDGDTVFGLVFSKVDDKVNPTSGLTHRPTHWGFALNEDEVTAEVNTTFESRDTAAAALVTEFNG